MCLSVSSVMHFSSLKQFTVVCAFFLNCSYIQEFQKKLKSFLVRIGPDFPHQTDPVESVTSGSKMRPGKSRFVMPIDSSLFDIAHVSPLGPVSRNCTFVAFFLCIGIYLALSYERRTIQEDSSMRRGAIGSHSWKTAGRSDP